MQIDLPTFYKQSRVKTVHLQKYQIFINAPGFLGSNKKIYFLFNGVIAKVLSSFHERISNYKLRPISFLAANLAFSFMYSCVNVSKGDSFSLFWLLECRNEDSGGEGGKYDPDCLPTM
jgi:hypothetical protein